MGVISALLGAISALLGAISVLFRRYWVLLGAIWALLGAISIISAKFGTTEGSPWNTYKVRFFASILKILGLAAYRTMQLQARSDRADVDIHVEKLLEWMAHFFGDM